MKSAVLDPATLFISEADWADERKRDLFLNHLHDNLLAVGKYQVAEIIWNDELESHLWTNPQSPPWRLDKDWSNQFVPVINRLFHDMTRCDIPGSTVPCVVNPHMHCCNGPAVTAFLKLMHQLIVSRPDVILCLGVENILPAANSHIFSCACCNHELIPSVISRPNQWLHHIDVEDCFWPSMAEEVDCLRTALEVVRIRDFQGSPFRYQFEFSDVFMDSIVSTPSDRARILRQMVSRLTKTAQAAAQDNSLQDEYLDRQKVYRFRVSPRPKSMRIHYTFERETRLVFQRFYDVGQHDRGLR